jgi:type I restriction enzyme M protein
MTVLRRLDCVLEPTKDKVLRKATELKGRPDPLIEKLLQKESKQKFFNLSKFTFERLAADPNNIAANLTKYLKGFSGQARDILEKFGVETELVKLEERNLLYLIVKKFAAIDLHPETVDNRAMGYIFEELIRKFNEAANEEAGDHFTPREVIRLMVDLLFAPDHQLLTQPRIVRTLYDPACGTGGMLSVAQEYLAKLNPQATLELFGQDWNEQAYAVCGSDMLIKGQNIENIKFGSSFTLDGFQDEKFDYMLANPPFGVKWEADEKKIKDEYTQEGETGRFGAGLPRINDGSFLFLLHMISKRKPIAGKEGGSRIGIVFNGSPLFTGDAGSGESNIRRWIIEHDWLEAIVALPDQLFYNTGIYTYIWIVTNRKAKERRGKVQLINAVDLFTKMRKSLGNKRNEIAEAHREEIVALYRAFIENEGSKIFDNDDFGYRQITVERPLRLNFAATPERIERLKTERAFQNLATSKKKGNAAEAEIAAGQATQHKILEALQTIDASTIWRDRAEFELVLEAALPNHDRKGVSSPLKKALLSALGQRDETADICRDAEGNPEPDSELRDNENVPLKEGIHAYFDREVKPHVSDAWIEEERTKVGYEIPLTRHFYRYIPPRPIEEIRAEIAHLEKEIVGMLREVVG